MDAKTPNARLTGDTFFSCTRQVERLTVRASKFSLSSSVETLFDDAVESEVIEIKKCVPAVKQLLAGPDNVDICSVLLFCVSS